MPTGTAVQFGGLPVLPGHGRLFSRCRALRSSRHFACAAGHGRLFPRQRVQRCNLAVYPCRRTRTAFLQRALRCILAVYPCCRTRTAFSTPPGAAGQSAFCPCRLDRDGFFPTAGCCGAIWQFTRAGRARTAFSTPMGAAVQSASRPCWPDTDGFFPPPGAAGQSASCPYRRARTAFSRQRALRGNLAVCQCRRARTAFPCQQTLCRISCRRFAQIRVRPSRKPCDIAKIADFRAKSGTKLRASPSQKANKTAQRPGGTVTESEAKPPEYLEYLPVYRSAVLCYHA